MRRLLLSLLALTACDRPTTTQPTVQPAVVRGLANPGFEDVLPSDTTHAQYWLSGSSDGDELVVTDPVGAHSGSRYMRLTSDVARGESEEATVPLPTPNDNDETHAVVWPVTAGDFVEFGGWAYRETGNLLPRFTVSFYTGLPLATNWLGPDSTYSTLAVTAATWTFTAGLVQVPPSAMYAVFYPEVAEPSSPTRVHTVGRFDDVFLRDTSPY